jgi:hypothetical protein
LAAGLAGSIQTLSRPAVSHQQEPQKTIMNKSSFLLLPTVLAVSASARPKPTRESAGGQTASTTHGKPKNLSVDFVFNIGK